MIPCGWRTVFFSGEAVHQDRHMQPAPQQIRLAGSGRHCHPLGLPQAPTCRPAKGSLVEVGKCWLFRAICKDYVTNVVAGSGLAFVLAQSGLTCCCSQELERCGMRQPGWLCWCWPALIVCWGLPRETERSAVQFHIPWAGEVRVVPPDLLWAEWLCQPHLEHPSPGLAWPLALAWGALSRLRSPLTGAQASIAVTLLHNGGVPQGRAAPVGAFSITGRTKKEVPWPGEENGLVATAGWQWHQRR